MKALLKLAAASAWNRRASLALVALCIALSTSLMLGLERLRAQVRSGFADAVSGTDLVVGARGSGLQLVLHAVFRVGGATQAIRMDSLEALSQHRAVAWVVPLALGDSYRGQPVLGTTPQYFERFAYADGQPLRLAQGRAFSGTLDGLYEAVLGAEVARRLGHRLGDRLTLQHGMGTDHGHDHDHAKAQAHDDRPFTVIGVLEPTGTPVDRTVHVSLQAIEALHLGWSGGAPAPGLLIAPEHARKFDLQPKEVSAALVGLKGRAAVFAVQRHVAQYEGEPLMAVLPGVVLDELWDLLGTGERALLAVSLMVAVASVLGLAAVVMAGLGQRRRELAVLRAVGAGPRHLLLLLGLEGTLVTLAGLAVGMVLTLVAQGVAAPWLRANLGIAPGWSGLSLAELGIMAGVLAAGMLASLGPAWRASRLSLADGLSPPH